MHNVIHHTRFKKDLRLAQKRGKDAAKLFAVVEALRDDVTLGSKHRPHLLSGDWEGYWECHIEPDWLLIYQISDAHLILARTGTHSDLFK